MRQTNFLMTNPAEQCVLSEFVHVGCSLLLPTQSALVDQDAVAVRAMRPKLRVLLVRFIAKCLLNPFYRPEWVEAPCPGECFVGKPRNLVLGL